MATFVKSSLRRGQNALKAFGPIKVLFAGAVLLSVLIVLKTFFLSVSQVGSETEQTAAPPPFPVWVASGLSRIGQTDPPGPVFSINISGARGETVDAQVVVQAPASGLTKVNVSASALKGVSGATILPANITLYREYYISVAGTANYGGGSNRPLGAGTYPEPLIPFNDPESNSPLCGTKAVLKACDASVSAGRNQPYWIDISIPEAATNAPPGKYTGDITITSDQGKASIPVVLTVWDFQLPKQPSELSLWTLWSPGEGNTLTSLNQALMRNKVMGWYVEASSAAAGAASFGLNRSALIFSNSLAIQCDGTSKGLPQTNQINAMASKFPPTIKLDLYVADELNGCPKAYAALKTIGRRAHAANFNVRTILTTNTPDGKLVDEGDGRSAVDHWALLVSAEQWPALPFTAGGDLWSYTSCNTGAGNAPEWMIDYSPINERIQAGFLNWTQGATGILYYRADGWTAGNTIGSWNNLNVATCGGGLPRPGDGIFVYPPGPIASSEPAPGIRLKAIRDGIQDYEYAQMLSNLGQAGFAKSSLRPIASSWTNWTRDPSLLESARGQLGQKLSQIGVNSPTLTSKSQQIP